MLVLSQRQVFNTGTLSHVCRSRKIDLPLCREGIYNFYGGETQQLFAYTFFCILPIKFMPFQFSHKLPSQKDLLLIFVSHHVVAYRLSVQMIQLVFRILCTCLDVWVSSKTIALAIRRAKIWDHAYSSLTSHKGAKVERHIQAENDFNLGHKSLFGSVITSKYDVREKPIIHFLSPFLVSMYLYFSLRCPPGKMRLIIE